MLARAGPSQHRYKQKRVQHSYRCMSSPHHMHCRFLQRSGQQIFVAFVALLIAADAIISTLWLLPFLLHGTSLRLQQFVGAWIALNIISNFLVCVLCSPGESAFCHHTLAGHGGAVGLLLHQAANVTLHHRLVWCYRVFSSICRDESPRSDGVPRAI